MIQQFLQSVIDLIASEDGLTILIPLMLTLCGIFIALITDRIAHQSNKFYADERAERHVMIEAMIIEARTRGLLIETAEKGKRTVTLGDDGELVEVEG